MLFLEDILSILLSNPKIYSQVEQKNLKFKNFCTVVNFNKNDKIFDIFDGAFLKNLISRGFYKTADLCFTSVCFIDEIPFGNSFHNKICAIYLSINELDWNIRSKEPTLIPIAFFQTRYEHHNSIFTPLACMFQVYLRTKKKLIFHHYKLNESGRLEIKTYQKEFRFLNIAFTIDKASSLLVLDLNMSSGYCSCWSCLIIGLKIGREHVYFPFIGKDVIINYFFF